MRFQYVFLLIAYHIFCHRKFICHITFMLIPTKSHYMIHHLLYNLLGSSTWQPLVVYQLLLYLTSLLYNLTLLPGFLCVICGSIRLRNGTRNKVTGKVLATQDYTERIVRTSTAIIVNEVEHTCIAMTVMAPTTEERSARTREVRVGSEPWTRWTAILIWCLVYPISFFPCC